MVARSATLTLPEVERLQDCEINIERGRRAFVVVGKALAQIRTERLYREKYDSFGEYCAERWGYSRARAYEFIHAYEAAESVSGNARQPQTARVASELAAVPAESRAEVWQEAIDTAPLRSNGEPHVTARHVAETAGRSKPASSLVNKLKARITAFLRKVVTPCPAHVRAKLVNHIRELLDDL